MVKIISSIIYLLNIIRKFLYKFECFLLKFLPNDSNPSISSDAYRRFNVHPLPVVEPEHLPVSFNQAKAIYESKHNKPLKPVFRHKDKVYPPDGTICPHCGAPVSPDLRAPYEKDKIVAGLLAIFLGGLGIHYFYMGKTVAGILSIVFTLVSCGIWQVVMFIQGVLMLTMTDEAFRGKYVGNDSTFPLF